jgi:RNA polymerase sigma-70 factor, ECF subfamily
MRIFTAMDADEILVQRAKRGERFAFERLVENHEQRMYTLAARVLGSREDAADAVQEALLRAWLALPKFRGDARFSTWLYRIVVNAAHDVRAKRRERPIEEPPDPADPRDRFADQELSSELQRALDGLDETYRVAVVLYDVLGCSYAEIAQMTGVPEGTVKSRIFRGRSELAERLGTPVQPTESKD